MSDTPVAELLPPGGVAHFEDCAREPIHVPGAVQPHGALLVVRMADGAIVQASANVCGVLGTPAGGAAGTSLASVLGEGTAVHLLATRPEAGPAESTTVRVGERAFDALVYGAEPGYLTLELEPAVEEHEGDALRTVGVRELIGPLRSTTTADELLGRASQILRDITGYDRVWAYRFEQDGHGVIVGEAVRDGLASFLGLHFPEGDIPAQARALYLRTGVRIIVDTDAEAAALQPLVNPDTGAWTDMSDGGLRSVSPMHIAYLQGMGARASLSVALAVDGRLWGLLSAHHYAGPRRVGRRERTALEMLGMLVGMRLDVFERTRMTAGMLSFQQHHARVLESVATAENVPEGLVADAEALLGTCAAGGAIVRVGASVALIGETPPRERCVALLDALHARPDAGDMLALDCVSDEHPGFEDIAGTAAGVLSVPLSLRHANAIVWLRPEQVHEVSWGNPVMSVEQAPDGDERLTPRGSFERWTETVRLRARSWLPEERASAVQLRSALGTLLLSQAEALTRANIDLVRANAELDAFAHSAAHDLREPLRSVYTLATFLVEDYREVLDDAGRERVSRLVAQAQRMASLLDSLLDYATLGRNEVTREDVSVRALADEAAVMLSARMAERPVELRFGPDAVVRADHTQLLTVLTNLLDNALKYSTGDGSFVEVGVRRLADTARGREVTGAQSNAFANSPEPLAVYVADNGIGIPPEDREVVFQLFRRLERSNLQASGTGAGLTIVRRIVERHGGVIWVEDNADGGATFCFTVEP